MCSKAVWDDWHHSDFLKPAYLPRTVQSKTACSMESGDLMLADLNNQDIMASVTMFLRLGSDSYFLRVERMRLQ